MMWPRPVSYTHLAEWNEYLSKLEAYGLSDYLGIMQKYLDAYYA